MQFEMFDDITRESCIDRPINVASVPQRSPFRYPGGKTWLVPTLRKWLRSLSPRPHRFIEPFAGGGIISLTVAAEDLAERVTMVELDDQVAAVWKTIIQEDLGDWLAERISNFEIDKVTTEDVRKMVDEVGISDHERAFRTILKNRTYHGGILAPGSSPIKYGENGKGIASRWYPETLRKRILAIRHFRKSIEFIQGDGLLVMEVNSDDENCVFFIDPPYTAAGKKAGRRLYSRFELDHEKLFELAGTVRGDFLMTYDNAEGVRALANKHGFDTELISMKNTHHTEMTELLIGRNLEWAR